MSTSSGGHAAKAIDEMATINHGIVKLAGSELGVKSFGLQVFDFPPNFEHYPEHDHASDGQEEVYAVLSGSAEFEVDGERVPIDSGRIVRVPAGVRRKLLPGPDGVRILAIGGYPDKQYERPKAFEL
jgi:mannose-6-phosphate isomerase-like protein (cupin superfamily)